jgi:hypothetical protein
MQTYSYLPVFCVLSPLLARWPSSDYNALPRPNSDHATPLHCDHLILKPWTMGWLIHLQAKHSQANPPVGSAHASAGPCRSLRMADQPVHDKPGVFIYRRGESCAFCSARLSFPADGRCRAVQRPRCLTLKQQVAQHLANCTVPTRVMSSSEQRAFRCQHKAKCLLNRQALVHPDRRPCTSGGSASWTHLALSRQLAWPY